MREAPSLAIVHLARGVAHDRGTIDLAGALRQAYELADVVLLTVITLWLGNMLLQESGRFESDDKA